MRAFIGCCGPKLSTPVAAIDLYRSRLFLSHRALAEHYGAEIWILSSQYGLIKGSTIIAPYNRTLQFMSAAELRVWNFTILQSVNRIIPGTRIMTLAGGRYLGWQKQATHLEYFNPFGRALRLGPRVQWIKRQLGDAAPCGGLTKRRAQ